MFNLRLLGSIPPGIAAGMGTGITILSVLAGTARFRHTDILSREDQELSMEIEIKDAEKYIKKKPDFTACRSKAAKR